MATAQDIPLCPSCRQPMKLRNSERGPFWGCSQFPRCRGTLNIVSKPPISTPVAATGGVKKFAVPDSEPVTASQRPPQHKYEPIVKVPGSEEQEAIWAHMLNGISHMVSTAGPGVGKTFSMIQGCRRLHKTSKILFVAFNKHIAAEANGKLTASGCANVRACTYHSLGYRILRDSYRAIDIDDNKMTGIFEAMCPMPPFGKAEWRRKLNLAAKLAGYVKNYLIDYDAPGFREDMERLADHHDLEMDSKFNDACDLVPEALNKCKAMVTTSCDYNDMIWLPVVLELPVKERVDMMITDESQDLNVVQHSLTLQACPQGRIVIVGDKHQAIYGFRGSNTASIEILAKQLEATPRGVKEFPLTITRRCPQLHVKMAQSLFPHIQAMPDAPLGEIIEKPLDKAIGDMKAGDMVICRVNKELIPLAYSLIKRGIRPVVKGRDLGRGLLSLVDVLEKRIAGSSIASEIALLAQALNHYRYEEESKLSVLGDKAEGRITALRDKCDCLLEFITNSSGVQEIRNRIETLFSDTIPDNTVVLGTVHRTKGLESERVFVLAPDLIPHPMAKKAWELEQERNIAWIAVTRAKYDNKTGAAGTIIFCGGIPSIYGDAASTVNTPAPVYYMGPATEETNHG